MIRSDSVYGIGETTALRAGLPGPWQNLAPALLGAFAHKYVWRGNQPVASPPAHGTPSPFTPHLGAGQDRGLRRRDDKIPVPAYQGVAQRAFRGYARSHHAKAYTRYHLSNAGGAVNSSPRVLTAEEVADLHRYQPRTVIAPQDWPPIREFVVEVMLTAGPYSRRNPSADMTAVTRYVDWCHRVMGLELERQEIFDRRMIAYYAAQVLSHMKSSSRGTLRSRLLWVGDHLVPGGVRARKLERIGRKPASRPYQTAEVAQLTRWASAQGTAYSRHGCWAILTFGLGAGLSASELDGLVREDVDETADGVIVTVRQGRSPREVVMLSEWEDYALVLAESVAPGAFIFRSHRRGLNESVIAATIGRSRAQPGVSISMDRMRFTWSVRLLNSGCPVPLLLKAGGWKGLTTLDRALPYLDEIPAAQAIQALRDDSAQRKAQFRSDNPEYCNQVRRSRYHLKAAFAREVQAR